MAFIFDLKEYYCSCENFLLSSADVSLETELYLDSKDKKDKETKNKNRI